MLKYVDLFSGCGGLSLGIEEAGVKLIAAVEKSDMAARTFFHNFVDDASDPLAWSKYVDLSVSEQIESRVIVNELGNVLADKEAMDKLSLENLDIVVGGPPCQGFSLAGRRDPSDARNLLPWQYLEFVAYTNPKAVVIENVVGMNQRFDTETESAFSQLRIALSETGEGYVVQEVLVNAMHYGAPQHRPRLMLIALRRDIATAKSITASDGIWKSGFTDEVTQIPRLAPSPVVSRSELQTVKSAVSDLKMNDSQRANSYVKNLNEKFSSTTRKNIQNQKLNHVERKHTERTVQRFRLYQYLAENDIKRSVISIANGDSTTIRKIIGEQLRNAKYPAVAPDGTILAKTQNELVDLIIDLRTKKHSQKVLAWNEPARTVVTLPDDYVHPSEPRIFTVREMARFQGFPDSFEFLGKETTGAQRRKFEVPQYSQVGNAVSPWLSAAVGKMLTSILN